MTGLPSAHTNLCTDVKKMVIEPRSLMHLPAEVRLIIYKHLFSNFENITLDINDAGYIALTRTAKLDLASLRTCKSFYVEACPVVYGINTFAMPFNAIRHLMKLRQRSRLCIENLTVEARRLQPNYIDQPVTAQSFALYAQGPGILITRQPDSPSIDFLDLATIGTALGGLQNLVVNTSNTSTFLTTILRLTNSLPCSPIRAWPVLEVCIHIRTRSAGNRALDHPLSLSDDHKKSVAAGRQLSALSDISDLGLGHEMPDLKTIRVNGTLTWELCQLVENHKSSFGDCSFEKQTIQESTAKDHEDSKYRYIWRRVDDDEQQAKARNATVIMHQWVPRLKKEDYLNVLAAFHEDLGAVRYSWSQN